MGYRYGANFAFAPNDPSAFDSRSKHRYPKPIQVSLKYAEEHFADFISAVSRGEEVEIAQAEKPSIKLVASAPAPKPLGAKRILGVARRKIGVPTWEQWKAMDKEIEREMCDARLISSGDL